MSKVALKIDIQREVGGRGGEGWRKTRMAWQAFMGQATQQFFLLSFDQNIVAWPLLTAREPGKCCQLCAQKEREMALVLS